MPANLVAIAELRLASESIVAGSDITKALECLNPQTFDLVSNYWALEEMCRMTWEDYYLRGEISQGVADSYCHYRQKWSTQLAERYGWDKAMMKQAFVGLEAVLSRDWQLTLATVAGENVANQVWANPANRQSENLRQTLGQKLNSDEQDRFKGLWQDTYRDHSNRTRCLSSWLEIMQAVAGPDQ